MFIYTKRAQTVHDVIENLSAKTETYLKPEYNLQTLF